MLQNFRSCDIHRDTKYVTIYTKWKQLRKLSVRPYILQYFSPSAVRKEFTRRAQAQSEEMKERMQETEETLQETHETQKAVSADMTRQYKTMQTEMGLKIYQLETDLTRARIEIGQRDCILTSHMYSVIRYFHGMIFNLKIVQM